MKFVGLFLATALLAQAQSSQSSVPAALKRGFENPPDDARIMMRWWWFGPAVTRPELEREMRMMKAGGIGGFEVQPVYPMMLDGNFPYLSPEFLDALRFTGEKARELGLRMDLTLASGWPYGGPHIPLAKAAGKLRIERTLPQLGEGESLIANLSGLFFISSRTRQTVKRAAMGAEGYVLDHYDRSALDIHLKTVGEPMLEALKRTPPYAIFSDSLEVYGSDWTPDFLAEFQKRRGYDLTPYLPALQSDIGERTGTTRHDWARTLTELFDENYLAPLNDWAHRHNTRFRSQSYGTPPASLSSNALVDLPEGEGSRWREFSATRWASSASHLYGRPVTSSETWTWLDSPAFRATPLDMKAEADRHFLQGINQLVGHGWPYSPPAVPEPGWSFYAAAVFNEHNPWWIVMPDVTAYLQRVSYLLRQGSPANDVAIYLPTDDAWASFTPGNVSLFQALGRLLGPTLIPQILDAGYNFDFIDDEAIARVGVPYPIIILPKVERMPESTKQKIGEYRRRGGIVLDLPRTPQLTDALHTALAPDAALPPEVGFVHRQLESADIYFLANTTNRPVNGPAKFRISNRTAQWWDPFTGKTAGEAGSHIDLVLAPYESRVLVFSNERGSGTRLKAPGPSRSIDISQGWTLTFPDSPQPVTLARLRSWTEDPDRKYYSGSATYEKIVTIDRSQLHGGRDAYLNFGEATPIDIVEPRSGNGMRAMLDGPIREAAVVYVNGKRAGSVWRPPYEIPIGSLLRPGSNTVRVVTANLAINRLAKGPLPDYRTLNARFGERFQPQDMANLKPLPSGILGTVRLILR